MKPKLTIFTVFLLLVAALYSQENDAAYLSLPGAELVQPVESRLPELKHNSWELIIYRPENSSQLNDVRCWLKIEDENGNDVAGTKAKATYEWVSIPDVKNFYKKKYWISGGMAVHLQLKPGKYRFSVYTTEEELVYFSGTAKNRWESNVFEYDTENPAKVIFIVPEANDNGFYSGRWFIDYKAPEWHKFTKPRRY